MRISDWSSDVCSSDLPPSAWAVAKRDAPQIAEQCWTHSMPKGPGGRFAPFLPYFWGMWEFSPNKSAAKDLLVHLSQPDNVGQQIGRASCRERVCQYV